MAKALDLYTRDREARAELSPELVARENALTRGHRYDDHEVAKLERALFTSCMINRGMEDGAGDSFGFDYLRRDVANHAAAA